MASDLWWGLPGPQRFLRSIADDVEEGRSVIVALPQNLGGETWADKLERAQIARSTDLLPPSEVRTCASPMDLVARHLLPSPVDLSNASVETLCTTTARLFESIAQDGGHVGQTVAVLECDSDWPAWNAWKTFLVQWAKASRNMPRTSRIAFIAIVAGRAHNELPPEQDSLRVRASEGLSDDIDMLAYAHLTFADWPAPTLHRRVAAAVAASLAVWDPEVVEMLSAADLPQLLNPKSLLLQFGKDRRWTNAGLRKSCSWENGQAVIAGTRKKLHSAALAVLDDNAAIESRIWAGQVGVLLPLVEEFRLETIDGLQADLRLPWPTSYAPITTLRDLEISHLCDQVRQYRLSLEPRLKNVLPVLRQIRNRLAHSELVDAALLSDERLLLA